jgi:hypothetical protein
MLGALLSRNKGELTPVTLRETLARQSGMYAVARKISDEQANELIGSFCKSEGRTEGCPGCLKTVLWRISAATPITSLPSAKFDVSTNQVGNDARALPMLCQEACNLLVSKAREAVKKARSAG